VANTPAFENFLPTRAAADRLVERYFGAVHPIAPCLHRPSFLATYRSFWEDVNSLIEPRPSVQGVVFGVMFGAAVSMSDAAVEAEFGAGRTNLVDSLKMAVETALSKANFLRTTSVEVLQAFVIYMVSSLSSPPPKEQ
jgi:hypothetical protein